MKIKLFRKTEKGGPAITAEFAATAYTCAVVVMLGWNNGVWKGPFLCGIYFDNIGKREGFCVVETVSLAKNTQGRRYFKAVA